MFLTDLFHNSSSNLYLSQSQPKKSITAGRLEVEKNVMKWIYFFL